jgi:predicted GH43/DUF377 family glycosyl hydrolase
MELSLKLTRSKKNPILGPTNREWENKLVFNPGVIQVGGKIHLLYRAHGEDSIAHLGYARLKNIDEVEERLTYPVFSPEEWFEPNGVEDPRLIAIDDRIHMIYSAKDKDMARVAESHISVSDFIENKWRWSKHRLVLPIMVSIHNRNATYFPRRLEGKLVLLHRPVTMAQNIWLSYSYDSIHWYDHKEILMPRSFHWDDAKVGVAGPPIELEEGWLLLYHGVEAKTWTYRLGCALLDKGHPEIVEARCSESILEPAEDYEISSDSSSVAFSPLSGTPNVVFSCGAVVIENKLVLYYGAADKVIGVAVGDLPGKPV